MRAVVVASLATASLGTLGGCGSKTPPVAVAEPPPAITMEAPGDAAAFIRRLVDTGITDFAVASGSGGSVTYTTWSFTGSGTWSATSAFRADGEEFPCTEAGSWAVEGADGASSATVQWTLEKTTCPTREPGVSTRAAFTLEKNGDYDIAFR